MPMSFDLSCARLNPAALRALRGTRTIRGRIWIAFLVVAMVTAALGSYAVVRIDEVGQLTARTFDQSLMAVNYARAAGADFAAMESAFVRCSMEADPVVVDGLRRRIAELHASLLEDLAIAGERSQSLRAMQASLQAKEAAARWDATRAQAVGQHVADHAWRILDGDVAALNEQIDLLINYTAGDGFSYRQQAKTIVASDIRATLVSTAATLLIAALVMWFLARRVIGPVASASTAAREIARGRLDGTIPPGHGDELGELLAAMAAMRDNIRTMMQREVAQRRSAQSLLADALESSDEGIAVVDASGHIVLANRQLANFLAIPPRLLQPGTPAQSVAALLDVPASQGGAGPHGEGPLDDKGGTSLVGDRWLRIGRSATGDGGFIAMVSDVTALKSQEARLRATNLNFDAALANMSQGLCLYDADSRLVVVNRRFADVYRLDPASVVPGLTFKQVIELRAAPGHYGSRDPGELHESRIEAIRRAGGTILEELADGRTISIAHRGTAGGGWLATYDDVTERLKAERQISFMARHDTLTRLPNRVVFAERVDDALKRLGRGEGFAVLCLDLDRFKQVNDTLGHPAGDQVLRQAAERLEACVREVDTVCRLGGDEFAIVQCGIARDENTVVLAKRIIAAMSEPVHIDGRPVSVGVSVGIALAPRDGTSRLTLMKNADAALYRAKEDGRGVWRCFEPEMDARLQARNALQIDLQLAIAEEQFEVYYQPLYDIAEGRIGAFEALVRWHHPTRGMVSPAEFIPLAEEMGLIVSLGEWVLGRACREACNWPSHVKVAVNVSSAQFRGAGLTRAVSQTLAATGLAPGRLELEITETVLLSDGSATLEVLHGLKRMGVGFAMDDFGTGFSSLNYLLSFPFDKIKIDQSFVRNLEQRGEARTIVHTMIQLGRSLGMRVTAEGVETREQLDRLRRDGCDEIQGYFFSRPVPAHSLPALLATCVDVLS
jgi:diguanylate cyclase (GGDEF)-like protein